MLIIFHLLLFLGVGDCTDEELFETKTVVAGDNVKLTCHRDRLDTLFWIRLVSGHLPEVLGKTFSSDGVDPRIKTTEESETFVLRITNVKLSDAAAYYCVKTQQYLSFMKGADLTVQETTTVPPSDPAHTGDSLTLQCSVPSDSENKTCPGDHTTCCFTAGSNESHFRLNCTQVNTVKEYEKNPNRQKNCVYNFFKNFSSSDDGTCCTCVATCEERCENRSKLSAEVNIKDSQRGGMILSLLCVALAISLVVIAFLIYLIKKHQKKSCCLCNAPGALQTNPAAASADHQRQEIDEDLIYSAPIFTRKKSVKPERRDATTAEAASIYADVRELGLE